LDGPLTDTDICHVTLLYDEFGHNINSFVDQMDELCKEDDDRARRAAGLAVMPRRAPSVWLSKSRTNTEIVAFG
jgi:hypothetical protein